jgi:PIN domain nuclease of toxin-antitoxin system
MIKILADTHSAIWYLWLPENLSPQAVKAMDDEARSGGRIGVSAITLCEIVYLSEKGRINSNALELFREAILAADGIFEEISLDLSVCSLLPKIPRTALPDMPDRIIAATALYHNVPIVTKDRRIRESGLKTIW